MSYAFIEMRLSEVQSRPPEMGALQMEFKKNGAVHRVKHNRIDLPIEQNGAEMPTAKDLILNEQLSPNNKNGEKPAERHFDRRTQLIDVPVARQTIHELG